MRQRKTRRESAKELILPNRLEAMEGRLRSVSQNQEFVIEILELLNQRVLRGADIENILESMRNSFGIEAVGVRIREGDDYPYLVANGYPEGFIKAENYLCRRSGSGQILRDSEGNTVLECMCGEIIRGKTENSRPFFTPAGSFWTTCLSKLIESEYGGELKTLFRSPFISSGYESVAIVPLRCDREVIGVLQLNDSRDNIFCAETVRFFEMIAVILGIFLVRVLHSEQALSQVVEERVEQRTAELLKTKAFLEDQIREREAVEEEWLMKQSRQELALEVANLGLWEWNLNTDMIYFDQRRSRMIGCSLYESESDFAAWQNRIPRDDKLRVLKILKRHLADPSDFFEAEYRLQTDSGEWKWILDRGKVVDYDQNGKALRMVGICLDITHRKRVYEEQLYETVEQFQGIFESARDCIFVKDSTLRYTQVNPYFAGLLESPESQIVGRTDAELFGKDSTEILAEVDQRVLKGETVEQEHTRFIKGVQRTFLDTKVPMRNSHGKITGIIGISREITDRKRGETVAPLVGSDCLSPAMRATLRSARLAAQTDSIVLLTGESGAGKDHIARYIHDNSKRAHGPFFSINCAAVSPELAESELFGYESGAFTGSKGPKRGLLELAEGGTILLNEIGELSPSLQAKLLTFLDTRQFTRVGGVKLFTVNARLIAATNRNLEKEVKQNRFRQDLFYRLDVFSIEVPPLRQRTEDIPALVGTILADLSSKLGLDSVPPMDAKALKALEVYPWPGNVRELRNVLERALILCGKRRITREDLTLNARFKTKEVGQVWSVTFEFPENETINDVTMNLKRHLVIEALRRSHGSRKQAAALLGISPDSLKHYMHIFDLFTILNLQPGDKLGHPEEDRGL
ncbi:MAG: sigma 54-interacting transcriptional regulator [Desulfuromonadaceae bacterium]